MVTLANVADPATTRFPLKVVFPVTPKVPPTVALFVTLREYKVAAALVVKLDKPVVPTTVKVPVTVARLSTVKVVVFKAEVAVAVPPKYPLRICA